MDYHVPVLLSESIDGLNIDPKGVYVDVTYGGGGHSKEILNRLGRKGKLIAFDQDQDALRNVIADKRLLFVPYNFRFLMNFLNYYGIGKVNGILADLGVSSHHFDDEQRGFSFRYDSSLDMRMDQNLKLKAADVLQTYDFKKLAMVFNLYGELKQAGKLAGLIVKQREMLRLDTVSDFLQLIQPLVPKAGENKFLAKVFQALRIEVNREMLVLQEFLEQVPRVLEQGGRLSVITYHSLEDRMVKNFIRNGNIEGEMAEKDLFGNMKTPLLEVNRKVIRPTDKELEANSRSRSAKLRIAEKNHE